MKRVIAFILVICHINASMLLPEVPESDRFDRNGQQIDDINSVAEWIAIETGLDHTADDEDDDTGKSFHVSKIETGYYKPVFCEIIREEISAAEKKEFPSYTMPFVSEVYPDTTTPPPDSHTA